MTNEVRKLDLDELFEDAQALEVRHDGLTYKLPRLKTLSPKKLGKFQELGKKAAQFRSIKQEDVSAEKVEGVEGLIDEMLIMLCPTLPLNPLTRWQKALVFLRLKKFPKPLTFDEKMRVATFYQSQDNRGKAAPQGVRNRTGRK